MGEVGCLSGGYVHNPDCIHKTHKRKNHTPSLGVQTMGARAMSLDTPTQTHKTHKTHNPPPKKKTTTTTTIYLVDDDDDDELAQNMGARALLRRRTRNSMRSSPGSLASGASAAMW